MRPTPNPDTQAGALRRHYWPLANPTHLQAALEGLAQGIADNPAPARDALDAYLPLVRVGDAIRTNLTGDGSNTVRVPKVVTHWLRQHTPTELSECILTILPSLYRGMEYVKNGDSISVESVLLTVEELQSAAIALVFLTTTDRLDVDALLRCVDRAVARANRAVVQFEVDDLVRAIKAD